MSNQLDHGNVRPDALRDENGRSLENVRRFERHRVAEAIQDGRWTVAGDVPESLKVQVETRSSQDFGAAKKPRRWFPEAPSHRTILYEKQQGFCVYCGKITRYEDWSVDHKIPRSRGGPNDFSNKVGACKPCNWLKGNRTVEEFMKDNPGLIQC